MNNITWDKIEDSVLVEQAARLGAFGELLTSKQVAGRLDITLPTLRSMRNREVGPPFCHMTKNIPRYPKNLILRNGSLLDVAKQMYGANFGEFAIKELEASEVTAEMIYSVDD